MVPRIESGSESAMSTVFKGGQLIDGSGGAAREVDVLVDNGRFVEVGENLTADEVVEVTGMTLLPGLFDCHIHLGSATMDGFKMDKFTQTPMEVRGLQFPATAMTILGLGITTVRDAAGAGRGFREAIERGIVVGPRMQISVDMLGMTGGHSDGYMPYGFDPYEPAIRLPGYPSPICNGVDDCIRVTREMIRAGADVIKIAASGGFLSQNDDPQHPNFLQEEMDAIVRTAADLGRPVMAHAHGAEAIKRAVRAGVRSIEHGTFLDEEAARMMADAGTWLVATLTAGDTTVQMANDEGIPQAIRDKFTDLGTPERDAFRLAVESGVKVAMGTDTPVAPHGTNLRELELMADHGLTAEQSLMAGTTSAAQLMGLESDLGSIEVGKIADLVVVDGDPYDFATLKDRISQVWKAGDRVV